MSDLSRMLDDVYAMPEAGDVATDELPTRAPSWSSADALDEAFASWIPGPGEGASALERSMVEESLEMSVATEPAMDHDQWLDETEPVAPVVASSRRWTPSDDDILPSRRGPRRRRR